MNLYPNKPTGLWCREGTLDEYVVKEQKTYAPLFGLVKDQVVMDIGGNIGAFAYFATKYGASQVISFEPDPENIQMFKKQAIPHSTLVKGAIAAKSGTAALYLNSGKNKGMHSLQEISGRECIEVKTYAFEKALQRYEPTILKIDIEGGEYDLDFTCIPDTVEAIAIELHLNHGNNREQAIQLIKQLKKQFPVVLKKPSVTEKNWTTLFIGRRS